MKRIVSAVALACLPVILAAQAPASDRLTLDLYLEYRDRVRPADLARRRADRLHARAGSTSSQRPPRESSLWMMNADGSKNRFLVDGSGRALVARRHPHRLHRAGRTPRQRRSSCAGWTPRAPSRRSPGSRRRPAASPGRPTARRIAFTMSVDAAKTSWPIKLPAGPEGAKWTADPKSSSGSTTARDRVGFIDDGVPAPVRGAGRRAGRRGSSPTATGTTRRASGRRTAREILSSRRCACPTRSTSWRESEIYAVDVATGAIRQLTNRKGPDGSPVVVARRPR